MKIGVLAPANIAYRKFIPAVLKSNFFEYTGVATYTCDERFPGGNRVGDDELMAAVVNSREKAVNICKKYGGKLYESYWDMIEDVNIEAIYIPLPPAYHYTWAKRAIEHGKHVLLEKPFTISLDDSMELLELASQNDVAVHENFMFEYHSQLQRICDMLEKREIGDIRLYRIAFGFPHRGEKDFRYIKEYGGGAFFDAGCYTICLARKLLGGKIKVGSAVLNYSDDCDVDLYGCGTLIGSTGVVGQVSFGMDNQYKCELQVWGSRGELTTNRIFTAPEDLSAKVLIRKGNDEEVLELESCDAFYNSLLEFEKCIRDSENRYRRYSEIREQAMLLEEFMKQAESY